MYINRKVYLNWFNLSLNIFRLFAAEFINLCQVYTDDVSDNINDINYNIEMYKNIKLKMCSLNILNQVHS